MAGSILLSHCTSPRDSLKLTWFAIFSHREEKASAVILLSFPFYQLISVFWRIKSIQLNHDVSLIKSFMQMRFLSTDTYRVCIWIFEPTTNITRHVAKKIFVRNIVISWVFVWLYGIFIIIIRCERARDMLSDCLHSFLNDYALYILISDMPLSKICFRVFQNGHVSFFLFFFPFCLLETRRKNRYHTFKMDIKIISEWYH